MAASISCMTKSIYRLKNITKILPNVNFKSYNTFRMLSVSNRTILTSSTSGFLAAPISSIYFTFSNTSFNCAIHVLPNPSVTENVDLDKSEPDSLFRKIDIEVKGHDPAVINSYEKFVTMAAEGLNVKLGEVFTPPKVITRYTLLKSVHIYKKHRVQYENRTHYRIIELLHLTGSTADTFLEYIQRNLPEGMAMKVTKYRLERLPEHVGPSDGK